MGTLPEIGADDRGVGEDRLRIAVGEPGAAVEHHEAGGELGHHAQQVGKDLDLLLALAARVGVPAAQAEANRAAVADAVAAGFGDRDMSAIAEHLRDRRQSVGRTRGNGGRNGL
jgi:hypothetical protein